MIRTTGFHEALVGKPFSATLVARSGEPPYTWTTTAGALPPGLTLGSDGRIRGTPEATGTFGFTAQVTDSYGPADTATASLRLDVVAHRRSRV